MVQLLNNSNNNGNKTSNCNLKEIMNDFNHLLCFHDTDEDFYFVFKQLKHEKGDVLCCQRFERYNHNHNHEQIDETKINVDNDNDDTYLLTSFLDKIHSFYYHSYDQNLRNKPNQKLPQNITFKRERTNKKPSKFNSNLSINDHSVTDKYYSFGQRFEYKDEKNEWFVYHVYKDLKQELVNNNICAITMEIYSFEYKKAVIFMNTDHVKELQNRNTNEILAIWNILSLLIYCNCDDYQNIWSSTYRGNTSTLKTRHSFFYFSGLYLLNLVEHFGEKLIDHKNKKFYHGVNSVLYFAKTITQFYGPLSTSSKRNVAHRFSAGTGLVLELKYSFSSYPLLSKYFACSFFSDYPNEKEMLFIGGLPMLIITNIINVTDNNKSYKKYITSIDTINSIMNGTYDYRINDHQNIDQCHQLLSYKLNSNTINHGMPLYVTTLLNKYYSKLTNIVILYDNVFGKHCVRNFKLKYLLNAKQNGYLFFNLNNILRLFPNITQIEYFNKSFTKTIFNKKSSNKKLKNIIDHIINTKINQKDNKLQNIIIYHSIYSSPSSSTSISSLSSLSSLTPSNVVNININNRCDWSIYNDSQKIIFYKNNKSFNVNHIKYELLSIKQGMTSKLILDKI